MYERTQNHEEIYWSKELYTTAKERATAEREAHNDRYPGDGWTDGVRRNEADAEEYTTQEAEARVQRRARQILQELTPKLKQTILEN